MKNVKLLFIIATLAVSAELAAQAGLTDATFGNAGIVHTIAADYNEAYSVAVQPDGKIVTGGYSGNYGSEDFAVTRYNANGTLDNSFGTGGRVVTAISTNTDRGQAVLIQADGKIVLAGYATINSITEIAVARYTSSGALDTTFGVQGIVLTAVGNGIDYGYSAALQSDGKIIVSGYSANGSGGDIALVRYNVNGTPDQNFGNAGIVIEDLLGSSDYAFTVLLQPDGKIITSVYAHDGTHYVFGLMRVNANGTLDNTFGTGGKVTTAFGTNDVVALSAVLQSDGKIVVAGYVWNASQTDTDIALARYNTNGTLDNTFGTGGKVTGSISATNDYVRAVTVQPDGKIVAAAQTGSSPDTDFGLVRLNTNGSFDMSFNSAGTVITDIGMNEQDVAFAMTMQPDGKIVVAGSVANSFPGDVDVAVVRYLSGLDVGVIDFTSENNAVYVYPNPVAENVMVNYTLTQTENISIALTDMQGKTICSFLNNNLQQEGKHEMAFTLPSSSASGVYLLVLTTATGRISVELVK